MTKPIIDHDPNEPPVDRGPGPWRIALPVMFIIFLLNIMTRDVDWISVCLGLGMGVLLAVWAIDITGNKVPASWRKSPRTGSR